MAGYISELYDFLEELSQNNNREWFNAHKPEFEKLRQSWLADLQRMIDAMAQWDPAIGRRTARECAYRIYRDTRFSPDKTPFKVWMAATFGPYPRHTPYAGYYMHLDIRPDESGLYGGIWHPETPILKKLRHAIADNLEEWEEAVADNGAVWVGETLKTAPKGWDKDHPAVKYLRMKDIGGWIPVDRAFYENPDWPIEAAAMMERFKPMVDFLNYSIDE